MAEDTPKRFTSAEAREKAKECRDLATRLTDPSQRAMLRLTMSFISKRVARGTTIQADEANSWDKLHDRFEVKRINHQEAYSLDGACTN